jgi:hypothetical protein
VAAAPLVTGAGSVVALVLIEWTAGWIGVAAWTQSWNVISRGHFRITAAGTLVFGVLGTIALQAASPSGTTKALVTAFEIAAVVYLLLQYLGSDLAAAIAGAVAAIVGAATLVAAAGSISGWDQALAAVELIVGAMFLGGVTNGMMLGHWYLNQPGLKPWALARLTDLSLLATAAAAVGGLAAVRLLAGASTTGAALGLPGFGASFGVGFFIVWAVLVVFTGAVVVGARRCIQIRSIQSATGLYYVALLTAGVAEFLVRYLMVNAK